jgi:hypothetical protein
MYSLCVFDIALDISLAIPTLGSWKHTMDW